MTAQSRRNARARGAAAEKRAARALGTSRVGAPPHVSAPDLEPIVLANGVRLLPEVKYRATGSKLLKSALQQAAGYARGRALPVAVLFERDQHEGIVCMNLRDFAAVLGLDVGALARPERKPERELRQLDLLDLEAKR